MCCSFPINTHAALSHSYPLLSPCSLTSILHSDSQIQRLIFPVLLFVMMSITIDRSKFLHGDGGPYAPIYGATRFRAEQRGDDLESCSSSSIGRNSDSLSDGGDESGGESEIQSSYKGPLDTMDALEEVLPVKRGISNFYSGKSKSFTSLGDVSSETSIKDLEKAENPYTRKRKNLLAHSSFWDKNHSCPLKNNGDATSKRSTNSSRSTFPIGTDSGSNGRNEDSNSVSASPSFCLPPLHPHGKKPPCSSSLPPPPLRNSPWRSFSLPDLQCAAAATPDITGLAIYSGDKDNKLH
ncbi:uncharacterized protein LOC108984112 [Juglans regia]|uniref:Uncharacterized protein LOC108984112 n=2 Tax=Juglans regia TaxID=51240 RepID=A0A2I4DWG7_JUGRE|nr:uncharacterized protein LOC108984112 [Juglans regia]